ncbi:MAG: DUF975 family protein [Ruminococcaceae bacterium]|nr:DUF975 family protein [Oscillospiraceae bacterium]
MKYAADFRAIARAALRGKWIIAVLTGFVASLIGAGIAVTGSSSGGNSDSFETVIQDFQGTQFWLHNRSLIVSLLFAAVAAAVIWLIVTVVISGAGKLGYAIFNLNLVDNKEVRFSDLFSQFHRLGAGFCMNFLRALYTALWTLLFIIPGIIKSYSYAMTPYILAEHPEMTASEAITASRRMMDGNKWRLFCLSFSFIGWVLLCVLPMMIAVMIVAAIALATGSLLSFLLLIPVSIPTYIGMLFLNPYMEAAWAAFYRDVSGTEVAPDPVLPEGTTPESAGE